MRAKPSLLVALLAIACSTPPPARIPPQETPTHSTAAEPEARTPLDSARATNAARYEAEREALAAEHPREWILIVGGTAHVLGADANVAWAEAERIAADAEHAYLYRAGLDEGDVEFALSPFFSGDPNWSQFGVRGRRPLKLTLIAAGNVWTRRVGDETLEAAWGDDDARLQLSAPGTAGTSSIRVVASHLFEDDLTITERAARELGVGRFEAPGVARYVGSDAPCRKVPVRVTIPELRAEVPTMAYVLPDEVTRPRTLTLR